MRATKSNKSKRLGFSKKKGCSIVNMVVSVGNTDNKLSQVEWHEFTYAIDERIRQYGKVHFFGGPPNWMKWQNVAWIVEVDDGSWEKVNSLRSEITEIRKKYNQESVFVMLGEGLFI
jgi:hypothetical protein